MGVLSMSAVWCDRTLDPTPPWSCLRLALPAWSASVTGCRRTSESLDPTATPTPALTSRRHASPRRHGLRVRVSLRPQRLTGADKRLALIFHVRGVRSTPLINLSPIACRTPRALSATLRLDGKSSPVRPIAPSGSLRRLSISSSMPESASNTTPASEAARAATRPGRRWRRTTPTASLTKVSRSPT